MSTPFKVFYDKFFRKIEQDISFFDYFSLTPEESMELATERAKGYLTEALAKLTLDNMHGIDFCTYNIEDEEVLIDCTPIEQDLIANLMFEMYLEKDIAKLAMYDANFTPSDLKVFSPSEWRSSFKALYNDVVNKNEVLLDRYNSKERLKNKPIGNKYGMV